MASVLAGITYFGMVFGVGFVLGSIRVPFLAPHSCLVRTEVTPNLAVTGRSRSGRHEPVAAPLAHRAEMPRQATNY